MNYHRMILAVAPALLPAVLPAAELRTVPLVLDKGGTIEQPAVFDGRGMTVDLAIDVTEHAWTKADNLWTSNGPLLGRAPLEAGQLAGLFVDEVPIAIPRDVAAEKLHPDRKQYCYFEPARLQPGQMGYAGDGSLYFRWPASKRPGSARVLLPPKAGMSCVTIACSHIIVRNITARHAANDGFNIHGRWTDIRLENVKALTNADEGISAHDDVEMEVVDAEVAWNGSTAGGVADVNRCVTSYRNCTIHDNLGAAFYFSGKSHTVADTLIYNQVLDFRVIGETQLKRDHIHWLPMARP